MSDLDQLLEAIDPSALDYADWLAVGMAIQHEGGTAADWDQWSQRDSHRYQPGLCESKWNGFHGGSGAPVTGGTLVELAKRNGWRQSARVDAPGYEWDAVIGDKSHRIIDPAWVEDAELDTPDADTYDGVADTIKYLSALFSAEEYVGYVMESWQPEDGSRYLPKRGCYSRTAGELISDLARYKDIGAAMGDYNPAAGAWCRFNPLDGQGVKDSNVTAFRYALIESDTLSIEKQAAIYAELELPVAVLVHSGKKSLHAIVRIDAQSKEEYRTRVNYLHQVCQKNGVEIDHANKNPSRLSRLPGVTRAGVPQYLVATNQGKASWEEWQSYIEELNDSLPDIEPLSSVWGNLPPLAEPLIEGVLRTGHKMLLSGPSKAGKSFLLLQLAIAIAEGREWLGWPCKQGKVLYINLELDRASALHRLKDLYGVIGQPKNINNLDAWHLRGQSVPMDQLAPKLIRRAKSQNYTAIIIDPIYKVITGDENAADKMAHFCNQFDKVCHSLNAAVIFCHHHSKGDQGQKASRDRASGSGVFARDPDVVMDLIELKLEESHREVIENRMICPIVERHLQAVHGDNWCDDIGQDDRIVAKNFIEEASCHLLGPQREAMMEEVEKVRNIARNEVSGWRIECNLREFAPMKKRQIIYTYPVHVDDEDKLADAKAAGEGPPWQKTQAEKKKVALSENQRLAIAYGYASVTGQDVTLSMIAEHLMDKNGKPVGERTARRYVENHPDYEVNDNVITLKKKDQKSE